MSNHPFCIFGRQPVLEAISAGKRFDKILLLKGATGEEVKKILNAAREADTPIQAVPKEKLDNVAKKYAKFREANHQGVIGFLSMIDYHTLDDVIHHVISKGKNPLLLMLDGITDVGNFGAIARSAECFGADAIVIPSQGSAQINAEAMKASAGALNKILVCREKSLVMAVKYLKANGFKIYGTEMKGAIELSKADFSVPCAVVMGSEGDGVSKELLRQCDEKIRIPMAGFTESLNVSVSAGVVLYEAMKQRS
ncbi:MAG: 23S rRNA (guanosine(2251)-2'-O)-methyltransferase RlmB [Chitinophagales bacterium]|nr:23S rRNA (guanosine(2251)-2'-O)-methyltransferase RlmB [Chitinophagales bacterium]